MLDELALLVGGAQVSRMFIFSRDGCLSSKSGALEGAGAF